MICECRIIYFRFYIQRTSSLTGKVIGYGNSHWEIIVKGFPIFRTSRNTTSLEKCVILLLYGPHRAAIVVTVLNSRCTLTVVWWRKEGSLRGRAGLSAAQHTDPQRAHEYCRGPTAELKQKPMDPPPPPPPPYTHQLTPCSSASVTVTPRLTCAHSRVQPHVHTTRSAQVMNPPENPPVIRRW